jgi:hypothetical protein
MNALARSKAVLMLLEEAEVLEEALFSSAATTAALAGATEEST